MSSKSDNKHSLPLHIAVAQIPITGDARRNGNVIRKSMVDAAAQGARLIQFPEGALTGYAKNPIQNWNEVDWKQVRFELESIMEFARELRIWVVLGSAHPLTPPNWPHNSLYIISDTGHVVTRYDKRLCSVTELNRFYTPGTEVITFDVDDYRFGCLICVEINFPTLLIEYSDLAIDCLLLSSYPIDEIFHLKARAYASIHNYWVSLSVPTECANLMNSGIIGPDGNIIAEVEGNHSIAIASLDLSEPNYEIPLNRAKQWRPKALNDFHTRQPIRDFRSTNRSLL